MLEFCCYSRNELSLEHEICYLYSAAKKGILTCSCVMCRDSIEAMKQNGFGMAEDLHLITGDWGFELSEVPRVYHGPFHKWQGGEDWCVAPSLQRLIKKIE